MFYSYAITVLTCLLLNHPLSFHHHCSLVYMYVYILFSIISGEHTVRIQKNYDKLVHGMSSTATIVDQLLSDEVLDTDDSIEILSKVVPSEMNRSLIEKIRDRAQYDKFIAALRDDSVNAELADDIGQTQVTEEDLDVLQSQTGYYCFKNFNFKYC